ncbi:MAG: DUF481 domain-containing protein [Methylococcales bacterium]|nr:DUF481 domain-containing protein [Methylococcales bacterium]
MKKLVGATGFISLLFSLTCQADTVNLNNGDQVSGEIITLDSKVLIIDTKYAGEIELNWEDISTLVSDSEVTMMLPDRSTVKGKITGLSNGQLDLVGGTSSSINLSDISKIAPVSDGSYATSGHSHLGGSYKQGNTDTFSLHTDIEYVIENEVNRFTLGGMYNFGRQDRTENENNLRLFGKYDRFIDEHWYGYMNTDYTKDRIKNLDFRIYGGGGLGYQFWNDDIKYLTVEAGAGYTYQDYNDSIKKNRVPDINNSAIRESFDISAVQVFGESKGYANARWAVDLRYWLLEDRLQFFHDHEGIVAFDGESFSVKTHTGFRVPVYEGVNLLAQFDYDYDNQNKRNGADSLSDYRYILGIGYAF